MDLLEFYISQLTKFRHLPMPNEICPDTESLADVCNLFINFTLVYTILALVFVVLFFFLRKISLEFFKYLFLAIISVLICFYLTDYAMNQLEDPIRYGIEWFVASYYFWCFFIISAFLICIFFPDIRKPIYIISFLVTLIFVFIFSYTGRGNFEQITPLAGGLFADLTWKMLNLSFNFKLIIFFACLTFFVIISGYVLVWVIEGAFKLNNKSSYFLSLVIFVGFIFLTLVSIPVGEYFNRKDVKAAKNYIDEIKAKADKYFFENGEYPKFIENMIPSNKSPKLLARQEFFTNDIKGTYYFSRKNKYCFIFQNPARNFGYYSLTSERGWRFDKSLDSYDNVFINLCDESNENYEDLISQHLGINSDEEILNKTIAETDQKLPENYSKKASEILEEKILEESKKDPSLVKRNNAR